MVYHLEFNASGLDIMESFNGLERYFSIPLNDSNVIKLPFDIEIDQIKLAHCKSNRLQFYLILSNQLL